MEKLNKGLIDCWINDRLSGELGYRDQRGLRDVLLRELTDAVSEHYGDTKENARAIIDEVLPSFEWNYQYTSAEIQVAQALKTSLSSKKPFPKKRGVAQKDNVKAIAAMFAYKKTLNVQAVSKEFYSSKSSFYNALATYLNRPDLSESKLLEHAVIILDYYGDERYGKKQLEDWWRDNNHRSLTKWLNNNRIDVD